MLRSCDESFSFTASELRRDVEVCLNHVVRVSNHMKIKKKNVETAEGAFRAREKRRLEQQDRWDKEAINNVIGVPWTNVELLTGWKTLLPSRADCRAFDKFTACKGRSLMRGKASGRWIDAERKKRYHALTTAEVLRWLNLVPTHLALQIRRPHLRQSLLMDREGNDALLGIFFGRLGAEVEGSLLDNGTLSRNAHPWALQLKVDLQSLKDIEPGREFIHAWQGNMRKLVMDEECRTLTLGSSACVHCAMRNVLFGSLQICETTRRGRPIVPSSVPSPQRAAPDVNFVRPRGGD